jgi:hypothetical protein
MQLLLLLAWSCQIFADRNTQVRLALNRTLEDPQSAPPILTNLSLVYTDSFSYLRARQHQNFSDGQGFDTAWYLILNITANNTGQPTINDLPAVDRQDPWRLESLQMELESAKQGMIGYVGSRGYMYLGVSQLAWDSLPADQYLAIQNSKFYANYLSAELSGIPEEYSKAKKLFLIMPSTRVPYEGIDYEIAFRRGQGKKELLDRYKRAGNSLIAYRSRNLMRLSLVLPMLPLLVIVPLIIRYGWGSG